VIDTAYSYVTPDDDGHWSKHASLKVN